MPRLKKKNPENANKYSYPRNCLFFFQLDFWVGPTHVNRPVDIMVSPTLIDDLTRTLRKRGVKFFNWIEDVQTRMDKEREDGASTNAWGLTKYNTYEEVLHLSILWVGGVCVCVYFVYFQQLSTKL